MGQPFEGRAVYAGEGSYKGFVRVDDLGPPGIRLAVGSSEYTLAPEAAKVLADHIYTLAEQNLNRKGKTDAS